MKRMRRVEQQRTAECTTFSSTARLPEVSMERTAYPTSYLRSCAKQGLNLDGCFFNENRMSIRILYRHL